MQRLPLHGVPNATCKAQLYKSTVFPVPPLAANKVTLPNGMIPAINQSLAFSELAMAKASMLSISSLP